MQRGLKKKHLCGVVCVYERVRAHACARASDSPGSDELLEMPLLSGMTGAGPQEESAGGSLGERPLLDGLQAQLGLQVEELTAQLEQREERGNNSSQLVSRSGGREGGRERLQI